MWQTRARAHFPDWIKLYLELQIAQMDRPTFLEPGVSGSSSLWSRIFPFFFLFIRRFYIAFVRPRLEYCNAAWCGLTRIQALRLEKVQVRVARAIVRCPGGSRSQVLQDAGLPRLSWRRREHCLGLLWKLVNGIGPPALLNVLPETAASRHVHIRLAKVKFQRHYYRVGSHLKFQTGQNETFQSVPELSGTYRSSFDVKSISSMTS